MGGIGVIGEVSGTRSLQRHSSKEEAMNKSLVKENIYKLD